MIDNSPETTKQLILAGILYFKSCRECYLDTMKDNAGTLLDANKFSPYAIVERTIKLFISVDIDTNPKLILKRFGEDATRMPKSNVSFLNSYFDLIESLQDKAMFTEQICHNTLKEATTISVIQSAVDNLKNLRSPVALQKTLDRVQSQLSGINKPGKLMMYNPVRAAKDLLIHRDKIPTGINFLDQLLGGGIVFGEHGGCLGPPSGGKSTIANMLLCNLAIQGYNTVLFQFEQSVKYNSDIMSRVYSYLTGLPMVNFVNKNYEELTKEAMDALDKCVDISDRIRVGSFTDDNVARNVGTIIQSIDDLIESGFQPKFVIIDWLGAVVSEFLRSATGTDRAYPELAQQIQDTLNSYGKEKNISFFYLHQTDNVAAQKPPSYKPNMHDSYYFKGFAQKLEYCLELGTKSHQPDGRFACWLHCGKVRGAEPDKSVIVLLDGANSKLEATAEGEYRINSKGHFVSVDRMLADAEDINNSSKAFNTEPDELEQTYLAGFK